jgi:hypothetical protein
MEKPEWGYDDEGDFALRIGLNVYIFYKWANPIVMPLNKSGFVPLTDANSKEVWKKVRKP